MSSMDVNKRVVRDMIDRVWVAGDLDALPDYWSEDCVNHAAFGDSGGLTALRAYHEGFVDQMAGFSDTTITVVQQVAEADRVVTHLVMHARHTGEFAGTPASGRSASMVTIRIDRLDYGKIAEHWSVADIAGLVAQLHAT